VHQFVVKKKVHQFKLRERGWVRITLAFKVLNTLSSRKI
jgi:hypothetical protein